MDVTTRVANYLLELPGDVVDGRQRVRLPWPKKDVASWLATTPESFSRALARLHKQRLISVDGDAITVLNPPGLEALASR